MMQKATTRGVRTFAAVGMAGGLCAALVQPVSAQNFQVQSTERIENGSRRALAGLQRNNTTPVVPNIAGTDLGFTASFGSQTVVMFGDTFYDVGEEFGPDGNNDAVAFMSGGDIETLPSVTFSHWADLGQDEDNNDIKLGGAGTPTSAASFNDGELWYATFVRPFTHVHCRVPADCPDGENFTCDTALGEGVPFAVACMPRMWGVCHGPELDPSVGLCVDSAAGIAQASPTSAGREASALIHTRFGQPQRDSHGNFVQYKTVPWLTNRFVNVTMETTADATDYHRPTAPLSADGREMLWFWGRSAFWQNREGLNWVEDADNPMYLARVSKTDLDAALIAGQMPELEYYETGGGWVDDESKADPILTDQGTEWEDGPSGQTSVTFVPNIGPSGMWVMLYGGGLPPVWPRLFGGRVGRSLNEIDSVEGPVKVRVAAHPWGPWSAPQEVIDRDSQAVCDETFNSNDPIIFAPFCHLLAPNTPHGFPNTNSHGALYGMNIVDEWTRVTPLFGGAQRVEIGWFVSTFNPYNVYQMKTVLEGTFQ